MGDIIFALDIGTQSVSGILLEQKGEQFSIIDYYTEQHAKRKMLDDQIKQVIKVTEVIKKVKTKLEEKHGKLQDVSVAAAGRALKTVKTTKTISILNQPMTSKESVHHLELSAIQQAQIELVKAKTQQLTHNHCIAYSLVHSSTANER